ncbi:uncharacterized protein LOC115929054 [Strongylocentrotus purpuratus]|uniref:Uncharacterized protein n=1 Tax=Strongylocentrotus purpuratus TaxID=7668 RepID=A0A7M7PKI9_STRPU|nr:uncharacterized protein LOC115929054 [Strongylocentrotus purpuratus]
MVGELQDIYKIEMELSFFVIFVILNQYSPVTADLACESGQIENDGSCYYFSESKLNFASSKSFCEDLGMHLVYIGSQEEQNFMQNTISGSEKHWIGLSKVTWIDGSSLDYNNFAYVFDDGGICFRMADEWSYQWHDQRCSGSNYYICENEKEDSAACTGGHTEYDESCYHFSQSNSNFASSKSSCADLGMHLVYIGSEDEQEFLVDNLPLANKDYWIGLSSVTWLDGSSLTHYNFAASDEKTLDEGGKCFVIEPNKSYQWLDDKFENDHKHRYICEKEGGIQSSSVQQTTPGAVTFPEVSTQTTPNQMTSSKTSSSTTQTDNVVTTSGSTQRSSTTDAATSETTSSPASTTPTSHASSTSTTGQGSTDAASLTSEQATDTTPATTAIHTTQTISSTTCRSSSRDRGHTIFKNFRLLASNVALIDAYVLSSYTVSSIIRCSQLCLADVRCSCYTYIACEGSCLLGKECLATSTYAFERRTGAKFYSALLEDQECF